MDIKFQVLEDTRINFSALQCDVTADVPLSQLLLYVRIVGSSIKEEMLFSLQKRPLKQMLLQKVTLVSYA